MRWTGVTAAISGQWMRLRGVCAVVSGHGFCMMVDPNGVRYGRHFGADARGTTDGIRRTWKRGRNGLHFRTAEQQCEQQQGNNLFMERHDFHRKKHSILSGVCQVGIILRVLPL